VAAAYPQKGTVREETNPSHVSDSSSKELGTLPQSKQVPRISPKMPTVIQANSYAGRLVEAPWNTLNATGSLLDSNSQADSDSRDSSYAKDSAYSVASGSRDVAALSAEADSVSAYSDDLSEKAATRAQQYLDAEKRKVDEALFAASQSRRDLRREAGYTQGNCKNKQDGS
jgi:hypothetical protein